MDEYCKDGLCPSFVVSKQSEGVEMARIGENDTLHEEESSLLQRMGQKQGLIQSEEEHKQAKTLIAERSVGHSLTSSAAQSWPHGCKKPCDYCKDLCAAVKCGSSCRSRCTKHWDDTIKPVFDDYCKHGVCPCHWHPISWVTDHEIAEAKTLAAKHSLLEQPHEENDFEEADEDSEDASILLQASGRVDL